MFPFDEKMIAALKAFSPSASGDETAFALRWVQNDFMELAQPEQVASAIFDLMERFPEADFGSPGPLVHAIESLGFGAYEPLLIESVQRQPVTLNVWMVNRILNAKLTPEHRASLLQVLQLALDHPRASVSVKELAARFLKRQTADER